MEYLSEILIVAAILIAVTVAAVSFEPANPLANWVRLAERYGTERRPSQVQYSGQRILFGGQRGRLRPLNEFVTFDMAIDDFGLWIICNGVDPEKVATGLKIPGTHVRPAGEHGRSHLFDLYAEPPVRIAVKGQAGSELAARCG